MSTATTQTRVNVERDPKGTLQHGLWIKKTPSYYTPAQVVAWLSCVGFHRSFSEREISEGSFPASLENLHVLVRLQLLAFPFENTAMHYTSSHFMDVSPEGAFRRLVEEHKGSYCFGVNGVFLGILQGLGYRAYGGAGRVNHAVSPSSDPDYTPLTHMVIFVQPLEDSNETYLVDVGFGSSCPTRPILLSDAEDNVQRSLVVPEKHRLTRGPNPASSLEPSIQGPHIQWHFESWVEPSDSRGSGGWRICYRFSEDEFFLADRLSSSFAVSMIPDRAIIFWPNVFCVKHFLLTEDDVRSIKEDATGSDVGRQGGEEGEGWGGDLEDTGTWMGTLIMLGNNVKRRVGRRTDVVASFTNEAERVKILRDSFGIDIDDEDAVHIKGRDAAL